MALIPPVSCIMMNWYGDPIIAEHISIDAIWATTAILLFMKRHSIAGAMAKGIIYMLVLPMANIIPARIGNMVTDRIVNVNLLLLSKVSRWYRRIYMASDAIMIITNSNCP